MRRLLSTLSLFSVVACATTTPSQEPAPKLGPLERSGGVHWMRNSAEYKALMHQTYALAAQRLRQQVAGRDKDTWAVASDADETILDNSPYAKQLDLDRQETTDAKWDAWVARRAAPPLPGAIEFLELVHDLGGRIAIVTNRRAEHCGDTRANFRAFNIPFDVILCREGDREKESRWEMIEKGVAAPDLPPLEIVLWLGDNIGDFPGLDQSLRHEDATSFDDFGDRFFVVPNPIYGSWPSNPQD